MFTAVEWFIIIIILIVIFGLPNVSYLLNLFSKKK